MDGVCSTASFDKIKKHEMWPVGRRFMGIMAFHFILGKRKFYWRNSIDHPSGQVICLAAPIQDLDGLDL